jgi:hypothetical protein
VSEEQLLRERLDAIVAPPSRIEVETLLPAVRRRVFRRRLAQVAAGAALTLGVLVAVPVLLVKPGRSATPADGSIGRTSAPASAPAAVPVAACQIDTLPVPAGMKEVAATAIDPTGTYVVGNGLVGQNFRPVLWTAGKARALSVPATSVQLTDVNAAGVAVGLATQNNRDWVFRYQDGKYTKLRLPAGSWNPFPEPAVNTAGDVLINAEPSGNSGGKGSIVLLWKAGTTTAIRLPLPAGANGLDLDDDGTIAGAMYVDGSAVSAWTWDQQGHGRELKVPAGEIGAAYAVRGDWVTGGLWPSMTAGLWNRTTGALTQLGKADAPGDAVNAAGWVVTDGRVLRDGDPMALPAPGHGTALATDVSDTGVIVGQIQNQGPREWRC